MTTPGHASFLDHVKAWFVCDVEPDLADLKSVAASVRKMAPQIQALASVVVTLAEAADPAAAPEIAAAAGIAKGAAAEVARIASELGASKMLGKRLPDVSSADETIR
jgi:hypothetical protein